MVRAPDLRHFVYSLPWENLLEHDERLQEVSRAETGGEEGKDAV